MKKMMKIPAFFLIVVIAVSLAACSSNSSSAGGAQSYNSYDYAPAPAPAAEAPSTYSDGSMSDTDYYYEEGETTSNISSTVGGKVTDNRKITFSANYRIETKRFDEDYNKIVKLVDDSNGYIANEATDSRTYYSGSYGRNSFFSLRVPVDKYNTFLDDLTEIGDVVNKNKSSEDLTSEYFDTEARIDLLKMRKDRLIEYIETATDPEVIIEFERELSNVLYDLDYYEGNKRRLDRLVDYATIEVNLSEVITAETIGKDGEPLGERAKDAFEMSLNGVQEFLRDAAVFFAGAAPVIALIVVIIIVILLIRMIVIRIREGYDDRFPKGTERKQRRAEKRFQAKLQKMQNKQRIKMAQKPPVYYGQSYQVPPAQQPPVQPPVPASRPEPESAPQPVPALQPEPEPAPQPEPTPVPQDTEPEQPQDGAKPKRTKK